MVTKRITANFFYLNEPENNVGVMEKLLKNQQQIISGNNVQNIKVSNFYLRITDLKKETDDNGDYWWCGIIERLETTEQVESSNLAGIKKVYAVKDDEGPIINTGFLYYPKTNTILLHKKQGGVNYQNLGIFFRKLLKETNILTKDIRKFTIDIMPDLDKLDRLKNSSNILALEYSIKMPENISSLQKANRPIFGDIFLANHLGGKTMKVQIKSEGLNVKETVRKVLEVMKLGDDNVRSLKAITEHSEIEEPLDLLTTRFTDFEDQNFKKGQRETVVTIMDGLNIIFKKQKGLIEVMYIRNDE